MIGDADRGIKDFNHFFGVAERTVKVAKDVIELPNLTNKLVSKSVEKDNISNG